jgi:hypothetical protein
MAPRSLIWSPDAIRDLHEIADFIALDKPRAARRWVQTLTAKDIGACPPISSIVEGFSRPAPGSRSTERQTARRLSLRAV